MRILTPLLALCALASPARAEAGDREIYVVLTGFDRTDPYSGAARRLAAHHHTKHLVHFDPNAPEKVLPALRRIGPTCVALVLRPEQIHVNSVRKILRMAAQLDPDPFVDFEYGYITGATADEADQFVKNIVKASRRKLPRRVGRAVVWGGEGSSSATDEPYLVGSRSFPARTLRLRSPEGRNGRDQAFLDANLKTLEGCGAILMGGHGMPWEIVSGPRVEDVNRLDLFPAVIFNYACYTAVTQVYSQREFGRQSVLEHLEKIGLERSFALAVIRRGAVGYVAYVTPRPAGPELTIDFQRVLSGSSMGAARRRDYAKITLGYLGFGEQGIAPPEVVEGGAMPRAELDSVRHLMLDSATGGILYGDPALRPFPVVKDALPLDTEIGARGGKLHITMRLRARDAYLWGADPFRRFGERTRQMAMKVYDRLLVPAGFGAIHSVNITRATWGGKEIETLPVVWAEERDRGRRYLHVKANFARRAGAGDIEVHLEAGSQSKPGKTAPEPAQSGGAPLQPGR